MAITSASMPSARSSAVRRAGWLATMATDSPARAGRRAAGAASGYRSAGLEAAVAPLELGLEVAPVGRVDDLEHVAVIAAVAMAAPRPAMNVSGVMPSTSAQTVQTRVSSMSVSPTSRQTHRSLATWPSRSAAARGPPSRRRRGRSGGRRACARWSRSCARAPCPAATVGKTTDVAKTPRSNRPRGELSGALASSPAMTGVIGVSLMPVSKPRSLQARLEEARVVPQPLDPLGLVLEHVDGGDAGRGDGRRLRGREEQRAGSAGSGSP